MKIKSAVCTDIGMLRHSNQDNFYACGRINASAEPHMRKAFRAGARRQVFAVCDGMGGEQNGETAAYLAVQVLKDYCAKQMPEGSFEQYVRRYVRKANHAVCDYMCRHGERIGAALAMLYIDPRKGEAVCSNIGDCKVFFLRGETLCQLTHDHNQAQTLVRLGVITQEEARVHKDKSKLTQHLGIDPNELLLEPYLSDTIMLRKRDILLLCSDGLTDMLPNDEIAQILRKRSCPKRMARQLVRQANRRGGRDNITVIAVQAT